MAAEIILTETPRRQAEISVHNGDNRLTWTFDAASLSHAAWEQLRNHGFAVTVNENVLRGELSEVRDFRDRIAAVVATLHSAMTHLERNRRQADSHPEGITFLDFAREVISKENESGESPSRVAKYRAAVSRLQRYLKSIDKDDILLRNMNETIIDNFNNALRSDGIKDSTRAFYNRILSAIYNRGVKDGLTVDNTPFVNVDTQHR